MRFTPRQLRDATGIAPETFRHWKKALRPLRAQRSRSSCFGSGDLLAVAIVRALTTELGLRVSALTPVADDLFAVCNTSSWLALERSSLVLRAGSDRVQLTLGTDEEATSKLRIVFPLRTIIGALRSQLALTTNINEEPVLQFLPHGLGAIASGA